jgi:hypothetical protein
MVSNYDRIFSEIVKKARQVAPERGVDPDALVNLVMEVVNLEDQHRTRSLRINQLVGEKILTASRTQSPEGAQDA